SGDWMVWVKHALGLLLASIGVYYLCVGLVPNVSPWVLPAGLVLGGLWLGFLDKSAGTTGAFSTFADTRVVAAAKRFDRYRVDLTHKSPEGSELSKRYRVAGPPIVVFLGKGGNEVAEARVVG